MKGSMKRDKRLTVRLPETLLARLQAVAVADGRSVSDWALRAVEAAVDRAEARLIKKQLAITSAG